jgi:hypothetical protein
MAWSITGKPLKNARDLIKKLSLQYPKAAAFSLEVFVNSPNDLIQFHFAHPPELQQPGNHVIFPADFSYKLFP